ncbi:MAG: arginine--tRNA ligase [Pirellulales bacterium]|nr:arginine--tRNA ligase [Pirellulales bacterium]
MNLLAKLREKIAATIAGMTDDPQPLLELVRRSGDPKFGDYQANLAMPLGKQLGKPPREVAKQIIDSLQKDHNLAELCEPPEVAGPGFINFRIKDEVILNALQQALTDERLGVAKVASPQTIIIDYSSPNVAKPLHVGHLRSTVIGGALDRTLRFLGHNVISDNHIGDWGTQFGMIIYGYKHFRDDSAYKDAPVAELSRLYRLVNQLVEYHQAIKTLPASDQELAKIKSQIEQAKAAEAAASDKKDAKTRAKERGRFQKKHNEVLERLNSLRSKIAAVESDDKLQTIAAQQANIGQAVLQETAKLHSGDEENLRLWNEFMPHGLAQLNRAYERLNVSFDHMLGESFYHDMLADVVQDLKDSGIAVAGDEGATVVFLEGFDTPMLVQKRDGAFLYSTSDLATIRYRMREWKPDVVLYVVDHRQSLHFQQLFAAARKWGVTDVDLRHIAFGTVMGEDGKPFKTRSSTTVGLSGLLDDAVEHAYSVVTENEQRDDDADPLPDDARRNVAEIVGLGGLKYVDLSHNRDSDYVFKYDKMLNKKGNTATYMQYAYARVQSIFRRGDVDPVELRQRPGAEITLENPHERALALEIVRFEEALYEVTIDYRPNQLTSYLFDQLSKNSSAFYENCPVLKAESQKLRDSRFLLCDLIGRTIKQGLWLLGIDVAERM